MRPPAASCRSMRPLSAFADRRCRPGSLDRGQSPLGFWRRSVTREQREHPTRHTRVSNALESVRMYVGLKSGDGEAPSAAGAPPPALSLGRADPTSLSACRRIAFPARVPSAPSRCPSRQPAAVVLHAANVRARKREQACAGRPDQPHSAPAAQHAAMPRPYYDISWR
eukprot:gene17094-biopygen10641